MMKVAAIQMVSCPRPQDNLATARSLLEQAAQALRAILQTQYLRYLIIGTWALGLLATVGMTSAALWFIGTVTAGFPR